MARPRKIAGRPLHARAGSINQPSQNVWPKRVIDPMVGCSAAISLATDSKSKYPPMAKRASAAQRWPIETMRWKP